MKDLSHFRPAQLRLDGDIQNVRGVRRIDGGRQVCLHDLQVTRIELVPCPLGPKGLHESTDMTWLRSGHWHGPVLVTAGFFDLRIDEL